jgi:succinoglycan biosynthesis protein ExoA
MNDPLPFITVMMPAYHEEAYIRESLLSLISTGYPQDRMEIIVADGQSRDRTREEVAKVAEQYPFVRVIDNPQRLQSAGCNLAAAQADPRSEYYIRVDAHSKWSENFLPLCIKTAKETKADLVVFVNAPVGITPFQKALAYALQHPLGVGNSLYRLGNYSGWVNHGQHGCFTKNIWRKTNGYSLKPGLRANEDVELSFRVAEKGGKIWLNQSLQMSYFPRRNVHQLAIQYFHYGIGRFTNHSITRKSFSWRQIVPVIFVWAASTSLILIFFGVLLPSIVVFGLYSLVLLFVIGKAVLKTKDLRLIYLFPIFPTIHLCWGIGFSKSLLSHSFKPLE